MTSVEKILPSPGTALWVNLNRDEYRSFDYTGFAAGATHGSARSAPGTMVAGPQSRAPVIEFEAGHAHVSAEFALGAARSFFPASLAVACDELVPLTDLWGRSAAGLREQLLEAGSPEQALALMEQVLFHQLAGRAGSSPARLDPAVLSGARALSRGVPVARVADDLGLLSRTLRRRFTDQVGLTPKRFARVQRLQRVVQGLDGQDRVDWAEVAAAQGYADQPHLTDEFRELAGVTPGEYLRSRLNGPNHLRFPAGD